MQRDKFRIVAIGWLAFLFALSVYFAATQGFTHDEALTWQLYLATPWTDVFNVFDPNHHFLATILFRLSTTLFGWSELANRLPTLLGALLYFWTVLELSWTVLDKRWLSLLAVIVLSANPLVLLYMVLARGYGISIALLLYGLLEALRFTESRGMSSLYKSAAALALSIAANLTLVIPVFAMTLCLFNIPWNAIQEKKAKKQKTPEPARIAVFIRFAGVLAAILVVFLFMSPLYKAKREHFYVGADTLGQSLASFAGPLYAGLLIVAATIASFAAGVFFIRRNPSAPSRMAVLCGGTTLLSVILLIGLHLALGMRYPADRTGIYLVVLAPACLVAAIKAAEEWKAFAAAATGVAVLVAIFNVSQLNFKSFPFADAANDSVIVLNRLKSITAGQKTPARVGISWELEPVFNFYLLTKEWEFMNYPDRSGPDGDFDYYVLTVREHDILKKRNLQTVFQAPNTAIILATKAR
jgi:hypothetical protein